MSELRKKILAGLSFGIPSAEITREIMNEFCKLEAERDQLQGDFNTTWGALIDAESQLTAAKEAMQKFYDRVTMGACHYCGERTGHTDGCEMGEWFTLLHVTLSKLDKP